MVEAKSKGLAKPGNLTLASAAAEAVIVYSGERNIMLTATNETNTKYRIDMDSDGQSDFIISNFIETFSYPKYVALLEPLDF